MSIDNDSESPELPQPPDLVTPTAPRVGQHLDLERQLRALNSPLEIISRSDVKQQLRQLQPWRESMEFTGWGASPPLELRNHLGQHEIQSTLARIQSDFDARQREISRTLDQFRSPSIHEALSLAARFNSGSVASILGGPARLQSEMERVLENIQRPYLKIDQVLQSVSSIAEFHSIGQIISRSNAFDLDFTRALRVDLGDWRDSIVWPEHLEDTDVRLDLYARRGLDRRLAEFPQVAFEEVLNLSGLKRSEPLAPTDEASRGPDLVLIGDGEPETRMARAFAQLSGFERRLRDWIDTIMTQRYGVHWPKHRLPNGMYDRWREKQKRAQSQSASTERLIDFADFTEYLGIIERSDNWKEVFAAKFDRKESVRESLQRLQPVRVTIMHSRFISREDQIYLAVEISRLVKAFRRT